MDFATPPSTTLERSDSALLSVRLRTCRRPHPSGTMIPIGSIVCVIYMCGPVSDRSEVLCCLAACTATLSDIKQNRELKMKYTLQRTVISNSIMATIPIPDTL
jgi:hypothetical protein